MDKLTELEHHYIRLIGQKTCELTKLKEKLAQLEQFIKEESELQRRIKRKRTT